MERKENKKFEHTKKINYRNHENKYEGYSDQISFRVGYKIVLDLNNFAKRKHSMKVKVIRDALNYWMSIDGNTKNFEKIISDLQKKLECNKRLLEEREERINQLCEIISDYKKE